MDVDDDDDESATDTLSFPTQREAKQNLCQTEAKKLS